MNKLFAHIPDDDNLYVGKVLKQPSFTDLVLPSYRLTIRPLKEDGKTIDNGKAELVLSSGEIIPVTVIGDAHIQPTPQARASGAWKIGDETVFIKDTDITEAQISLVRFFIQRQNSKAK